MLDCTIDSRRRMLISHYGCPSRPTTRMVSSNVLVLSRKHSPLKTLASILLFSLFLDLFSSPYRIPGFITLAAATVVSTVEDLREAVEGSSNRKSVITLSPGIYYLEAPLKVTPPMQMIRALEPNTAIISGQNQTRIFELLHQADLTLINLTLEDGHGGPPSIDLPVPDGGGCIAAYTIAPGIFQPTTFVMTSVTLRRCNATSGDGGAVMVAFPETSSFTCSDCVFENNIAFNGSGGALSFSVASSGSTPFALAMNIESGTFINNQASSLGGALYIVHPAVESRFRNVHLEGNYALEAGGAIATREEVNFISSEFWNNSAGSGLGNAVDLLDARLNMDVNTSRSFYGNGGLDGYNDNQQIAIRRTPFSQVRVVAFTPAPTPSNTLPPPNPLPQPSFPPYVPSSPPSSSTGSSDQGGVSNSVTIASSVVIGSVLSFVLFFVVMNHRRRNEQPSSQEQAEDEHNAFANRRNHRPKVVLFKQILPQDFVSEPCLICNDEHVDDSTIAKSLGTISATRAQMNSVLALTTAYGVVECGHIYHVACTIVWCEITGMTTCPTCRQQIAHAVNRRQSSQTSSSGGPANNNLQVPSRRSTGAGSVVGGVVGSNNPTRRSSGAGSSTNGSGLLRYTLSAPNLSGGSQQLSSVVGTAAALRQPQDLVVTVPEDVPYGHVARRSTNIEDHEAENAVLMREMNQAVARLEDVKHQKTSKGLRTSVTE